MRKMLEGGEFFLPSEILRRRKCCLRVRFFCGQCGPDESVLLGYRNLLLCYFEAIFRPLYIINIGINANFEEFVKKMKKILRKVCRCKNNAYLCIRNQEISSYKAKQAARLAEVEKRNLKKSLQKVLEKFGGLKNKVYLCTTFRFKIEKWFFKWFFDLLVI